MTRDFSPEVFSQSRHGEQGRKRKSKVGPLGLDGPEAQLPSISHTGQGHTGRCAYESGVESRKSGLSS